MLYIMRYIIIICYTKYYLWLYSIYYKKTMGPKFCLGSMRQGVGRFTGAGAS